jgi:hypothetical protein
MEDSVSLRSLVFPDRRFSSTEPLLLGWPKSADSAIVKNSSVGFLRMAFFSQPVVLEKRFDLVSAMRLQWKSEDPLEMVRKVLGMVQAGGAAYLTYLALKKYGYIK